MLAAQINSSLTSLGGNAGGGPYPTAPVGPLQIPKDDFAIPTRSNSVSPKPRSPRFSSHGPPSRKFSPSSNPNPHSHPPPPPRSRSQPRRPSPPSIYTSHHGGPPSPRPVPNPATAFPSFTAGRSFVSEAQLQNIINWQTVTSRNVFEDPPTYQSLLIFLLPSLPSPAVNNFLRQILNTPDHIAHLIKCWDLLKRDDREEMVSFGLPEKVGEIRFEIYRMWLMVRLAWRIVQALKNAKGGSRIAECGEWAMHVIETNKTVSPQKFDPIPLQTLACALTYPHPSMTLTSKVKDTVTPLQRVDRDSMAIEYFEMGFPHNDAAALFLPSSVYAKAHQARLYRRLGLTPEAAEAEQAIRDWWAKTGNVMMSKARFTDLVCSEGENPSENIILQSVDGFFERRTETGGSEGVEEADNSSSGRDSGVDVGPVDLVPDTKEEKPMPNPMPANRQQPPPGPRLQQKRSNPGLPPLKPYNPQLLSPASTIVLQVPPPPPKHVTPPRSAGAGNPDLKQYSPQMVNASRMTHPELQPYALQMSYDYTGSSDSLDSDHGKSKARASIGAKFGFRRRS
ncbi:hypothetical protein TWF694_001694 [Orbilia ellipsospora]|uniref:Uncharacterized protein n=1 Tax=Orbilia ellipsospora TaxID=2528407 RepID=A0AAV9X4H2_9PEZI